MTVKISQKGKTAVPEQAFDICREAADWYLNSGQPLYITAKDVCHTMVETNFMARQQMEVYDPQLRDTGPFIIDLRSPDSEMPDLYYHGHIPGAVHIPWRKITLLKMLSGLPKDRRIVVYSNSGQTGGQVAAILCLMGYDAVNLKWGMTSWTNDEYAAPARYDRKRDVLWQNREYRSTVTVNLEAEETFTLPELHIEGRSRSAIIWAAAEQYLQKYKPANVAASALYDPLFESLHPLAVSPYEEENGQQMLVMPFSAHPGDHDAYYQWPFVLDIRSSNEYDSGHIPGSINNELKTLFREPNLRKLPPDRQIVVCSNTGHSGAHAVALLNILGYDAVNLKWGMSGWTIPENVDDTAGCYYASDVDSLDYPIVKGWRPGRVTKCSA